MLEDVIRPPESYSSFDLPELGPVSLFDFTEEEILFAETLRNPLPPEISTSNSSEDTRLSSSSPSVEDSHRNQCPPSVFNVTDIDFQASLGASLPSFNDQFDFCSLPPFPSSYEEVSVLSYGLPPPLEAMELNGIAPVACAFAATFYAEMDCLSSLPEIAGLGTMLPPAVLVEQGRAFPAVMGSMQVMPMLTAPDILELHHERVEDDFAADGVRHPAAYSACRDLQVLQENQSLVGSACGSALASDPTALEENGFNVVGRYSSEERKQRIHRYIKKRNERNFNKKIKYACRKTLADSRPRVRGRFAKNEEFGDATASCRTSHEYDEIDLAENKAQDHLDSSDIFAHISGVNPFNNNYPIQPYWT